MVDLTPLAPRPAAQARLHAMVSTASGGVTIAERSDLDIVLIAARTGRGDAVSAALRAAYSVEPTVTPRHVAGPALDLIWAGPDQVLALRPRGPSDLEAELRTLVGQDAAIVDQGDGRVVFRLGGPAIREVLARGMAIDLHPRAFQPGDTAITMAAHMGVQIWQIDDAPNYELWVSRSFVGSFLDWFESAAGAVGIAVRLG